jgi:hypothetical protein
MSPQVVAPVDILGEEGMGSGSGHGGAVGRKQ